MKQIRCVMADDDTMCRFAFKKLFQQVAHASLIGECQDGESLLTLLGAETADVVFLDMNMPGISGVELMEHIDLSIQIVVTTGDDDLEGIVLPRPITHFVSKPVTQGKLVYALERVRKYQVLQRQLP